MNYHDRQKAWCNHRDETEETGPSVLLLLVARVSIAIIVLVMVWFVFFRTQANRLTPPAGDAPKTKKSPAL
jgi:hypothetical protein